MANSVLPDGSEVVDSHCHCGDVWYEPAEVLLHHMDVEGVAKAVLIQYFGQYDNTYQTSVQQRYPDRFASVVLIDPDSPTAIQEIDRAVAAGARGIRFRVRGARPFGIEPFGVIVDTGPVDPVPSDEHLAILRAAEERGLVLSLMGTLADFGSPEFFDLAGAFPGLRITVEHAGSSNRPNVNGDIEDTRERIFELAKFENIYLKFGGLGEFYPRHTVLPGGIPFESPTVDYLQRGVRRIRAGSDPLEQRLPAGLRTGGLPQRTPVAAAAVQPSPRCGAGDDLRPQHARPLLLLSDPPRHRLPGLTRS